VLYCDKYGRTNHYLRHAAALLAMQYLLRQLRGASFRWSAIFDRAAARLERQGEEKKEGKGKEKEKRKRKEKSDTRIRHRGANREKPVAAVPEWCCV